MSKPLTLLEIARNSNCMDTRFGEAKYTYEHVELARAFLGGEITVTQFCTALGRPNNHNPSALAIPMLRYGLVRGYCKIVLCPPNQEGT